MHSKRSESIPIALVDDDEAFAAALKQRAESHGLAVTWFPNWARAKERVKAKEFKLVILDAKGQRDDRSPKGDITHLTIARMDLAQWRGQNIHVPYVICTGFAEDATAGVDNEKRYIKAAEEEEMLNEIKRMVDRSSEEGLRQRFADVLDVFRQPWFDPAAEELFMEALLFVERGDKSGRDRLFMNPLRQVVEYLFLAAHKQGLLPDMLVQPILNQRLSASFLAGRTVEYPSRSAPKTRLSTELPLLPKLLASALDNVLSVTNWGSHAIHSGATAEDTNFLLDNEEAFREHGGSPYLLSTALFQLMDILVFFKRFVEQHPDPKVNKTWLHEESVTPDGASMPDRETKEIKRAIVIRKAGQNFAHAENCFISPKLVKQLDLRDGDLIDMVIEPSTRKPGTYQAVSITKH
ncbi:MAG: hypothetical protein KF905_14495 [Flavobacteriales bacterium]|nr:hypothetical protein [Flavobacteriales bacterium]